ncbi:MAG TPA: OsmC family protein [Chitinophagaceae bacterium]|nr:OsmC family protein [Chitinophagaceae bacterium]
MKYTATVKWAKSANEIFTDGKYSRVHDWQFDGGMKFKASASPHVVPLPMSDASFIDPEEAFIASISSCHMLFFLSFCAKQKYAVVSYEDEAEGIMGDGEDGKKQMLSVTLHPIIKFEDGKSPSAEILSRLHELSHENCFIANSVKTKINISNEDTKLTK